MITWSISEVAVCSLRLGEFRVRWLLGQQPYVFDRNRRLVGEGLDQSDLLVRKRSNLKAVHYHNAQKVIAFEDRHREHCWTVSKSFAP